MRKDRWNRPVVAGLVAMFLASGFVLLRLQSYDWNPTGFVHAGDRFVDSSEAPADLLIRKDSVGFDGTGFYRLALDPFTRQTEANGIVLDIPALRHQRILYPLLVWAVSGGGRHAAVGWALIAVNLAGLGALGWIGGAMAVELGRSSFWGLLFPSYPGFAVALGLDTAEIVASVFALGAIFLFLKRRFGWGALVLTAAMLTRETTLLIAIGLAFAWAASWFTRRAEDLKVGALVLIPAGAYIAWQGLLRVWWGQFPLIGGSSVDIEFPLSGLVVAARGWPKTDPVQAAYQYLIVAAMAAFVATVIWVARGSEVPAFVVAGFGAGVLLTLLFSRAIWLHHWGFLRGFTEAYLLGVIVVLASKTHPRRLAVGSVALWVSIAVNLVLHP